MKITSVDIRRKEFKRSVRGYLDEEVDLFLDAVGDEFERLLRENAGLQERLQALEEQAAGDSHIRGALEKTLVAAQLQSEEIRSNAEKESQSILRDAEAKAKGVADDLYSQTQRVQQTLVQLKLLEEDFRFKFGALLEGYLKLLEEGPILLEVLQTGAMGETSPEAVVDSGAGGRDSAVDIAPRGDDNPTSETEEAAAFALGDGEAEPTAAEPTTVETLTPEQPLVEAVPRTLRDTTEELTVETSSLFAESGGYEGENADKAEDDEKDGGVFFGRLEDDPNDPFPGGGAKPSKARDFEW